jgi:predicted O-linked N-acetylglucosamine transferase (SPINDLY family)
MTIQEIFQLGYEHHRAGRRDQALAIYRQVIARQPDHLEALYALGVLLLETGNGSDAIGPLRHAIAIHQAAEYHLALGMALYQSGSKEDGILQFHQALKIQPNYVDAHLQLGVAYLASKQIDEAAGSLRRAIELQPTSAHAYNLLGYPLQQTGQLDESIACFHKAMSLQPDSSLAHSNYVYGLLFHPAWNAVGILKETRQWQQKHATFPVKEIPTHHLPRDQGRRLRIGYVSPNLRDHVIGRNLLPLFREHDRKQFQIYAYASVNQPDEITELIRSHCDSWRDIRPLSDQAAADLIRSDQIDILVDLALHLPYNRLPVFACKPAPIQVTFAGYPGTTGLDAIDWRLTDPYLDPPGENEAHYAEKSYRLPHSFWCYDPAAMQWAPGGTVASAPKTGPLPASKNGFITFGCLNTFAKLNDAVLVLWSAVLRAMPGSRLRLLAPSEAAERWVSGKMEEQGVSATRLDFVRSQPRREYLAEYSRIDLCLDTLPYNGHTTSLDALWMGVPLITRLGSTVVGRAGWSQLSNLGLTELAAHSDDAFVAIATKLASDLPRLAELRRTLRQRLLDSPLTDAKRFARDIEAAFLSMEKARNNTQGSSRPPGAEACYQLGVKLQESGDLNGAIENLKQAIALRPNWAPAHLQLGHAQARQQSWEASLAAYRQALALSPNFPQAHINMGVILNSRMSRPDEALESYRKALALQPTNAIALMNMGSAYRNVGQMKQAIACYEKAMEINPGSISAAGNRLYAMIFSPDYDAATILQEHKRWDQRFARPLIGDLKSRLTAFKSRSPHQRLRIGYVSPNFSDHVVGRNILPLIREHDREQFEIHCYSIAAKPDGLTAVFRSHAEHWHDISQINDNDATDLIRRDEIDILVDLAIHMSENRLLIFARKPAPVQVTFAAYPGTSGLSAMDWRLTDPYLDPPDQTDGDYVERSYRLTDSFWCYDPKAMESNETGAPVASPLPMALPALTNGYVTFGCLSNFCKTNERVLALWCKVLNAVPRSKLIMMAPPGSARQTVTQMLAGHGVSADRIGFVTLQPRRAYLETFSKIDIGLDTFPYNGHTTSLDSMWMGVPVVSRVGATVVGRAGWSELSNLKLTEFAAKDDSNFVKIAVDLANDLPRLAQLRQSLRQRMLGSPLTNAHKFAGNIEKAYRDMWSEWLKSPFLLK